MKSAERRITPIMQSESPPSPPVQPEPIQMGSSRQITALAKKALSYQKRQLFTNICCIFACPCLMVAVAGILGSFLATLISATSTPQDYLYCSNTPAMSPVNIPYWTSDSIEFPYVNTSDVKLPGAQQDKVFFTNYGMISGKTTSFISSKIQAPCVRWFGPDYPLDISIYERPANISKTGKLARDASFQPQPLSSWLSLLSAQNISIVNATSQLLFSRAQMQTWMLVGFDASVVNVADIGQKPIQPSINPFVFGALPDSAVGPLFVSPLTNSSIGLFGTIPTRFYTSFTDGSVYPVPYYNFSTGAVGNDIDDFISTSINTIIQGIAKLDKSALFGNNLTLKNEVYAKAGLLTANLTHGGLYFTKINHANKSYSWNYHVGSDKRLRAIVTWPAPGIRMLTQQVSLHNAILRNSNVSSFGNAQITQGFRIFPQIGNTKLEINVAGPIGVILFPFGGKCKAL